MDYNAKIKRKQNPSETTNIFSKLTFLYTGNLFIKAVKKRDLDENDIYEVIKCCKSKTCGDKLEGQWLEDKNNNIYKLIWRRFGWKYLMIGFIDLCYKVFNSTVQPLAISKLISYFNPSSNLTKEEAYFWAAVVLLNNLVFVIYMQNIILFAQKLGMEMRTSFSAMLYRKALMLAPSAVAKITLGNIVTLITKDVGAFELSIWMFNDMWSGVLQVCFICYLLYMKIGSSSFIGIGFLLAIFPIQVYLLKVIGKYRMITGKKTDERLQETQETLSTIKIIKMYTWENFFNEKINTSRSHETKSILITFSLRMIQLTLGFMFSKFGFYVLIMSYIWTGHVTNTELIFYISNISRDLEFNLALAIPYGLGRAAELYAAIKRINQVIIAEVLPPKQGSDDPTDKPILELRQANVKINKAIILKNVDFLVNSGLVLVTGKVGSGKSSFIKTLLQDYPLDSGYIMSCGRISYASQDPWLFPSSIKQNITFGETFNEKRYNEVLKVCALEYDLKLLDKGDETIVSDRGLNLSKGQQARINLARAIYKESEMYLLDDSLTALDSQVQDYIFNACIKTFLKDKICILVTQTVNQIKQADNVIIMEDGQIRSNGKPNEKLLENIINNNITSTEIISVKEEIIAKELEADTEETKLLETEQVTKSKIYSELNRKGKVSISVYKKYLIYGGGIPLVILIFLLFVVTQGSSSYSEYLLTRWVDQYQKVIDLGNTTHNSSFVEAQDQSNFIIKIFTISVILMTIFDILRIFAVLEFTRRASVNLHKTMIYRIIRTGMSYFDTHFIGNILNRFSQDLYNIDEEVPFVIFNLARAAFSLVGIIIVISSVNISFLLIAIILSVILAYMRKLYLPAGRSLKRLEITTRSPMVGHINASLEGLTTIRTCKAQKILIDEFDRHQDLFTSAHYMFQCTSTAFALFMDFTGNIFITMVVLTFIFIDTGKSAGDVGLAITQVLTLSMQVEFGVLSWATLESLMTSVERLLEYTDIKEETDQGREIKNWPNKGEVIYKDVCLSYGNNNMVLKNLNFTIEPNQKIGIVGRTGAGKSSIIASIFRLYEAQGDILIDGMDIKTASLKYLRKSLAIIPQDPILFSGTIRTNLDPYGEFSDSILWDVLEKVNIKYLVPDLDLNIKGHASNFSSGQRQLISVARAILRKSKIVILDEATANMDHETDATLNKIIKDNFADCTVFTIAHRLETILQSDKVMVLDRGEIKEFDNPTRLLENKNGIFYGLVQQAGLLS